MLGHHLVNTPLGRRPTFGHGWLNKFQTDKRARALKHTHATADLVRQEKADVRQDVNYNTGCLTDDDDDDDEEEEATTIQTHTKKLQVKMDAYHNYNTAYMIESAAITKQQAAINTILAKLEKAIAQCSGAAA